MNQTYVLKQHKFWKWKKI